jgi:hypothetical protein
MFWTRVRAADEADLGFNSAQEKLETSDKFAPYAMLLTVMVGSPSSAKATSTGQGYCLLYLCNHYYLNPRIVCFKKEEILLANP